MLNNFLLYGLWLVAVKAAASENNLTENFAVN
jgi:hypothetical protein